MKNTKYDAIYGDTDSVYLKSKHTSLLEMIKEGRELVTVINESYPHFADRFNSKDSSLEIEFEKIFKIVLFVGKKGEEDMGAKKKYAYLPLWKDGKKIKDKVEYVGFGAVRSNTPRVARVVQKKVINMILHEAKKEDVITYLKYMDKEIRSRVTPDDEFSFPQGISNSISSYGRNITKDGKTYKSGTPPIIKGVRYSNKYLGTRFEKGSKPKWTYVKRVPRGFPDTGVIAFDSKIPYGFVPDFEKITKRIFEMKLSEIFKAASWGEFPILKPVTTLTAWGV